MYVASKTPIGSDSKSVSKPAWMDTPKSSNNLSVDGLYRGNETAFGTQHNTDELLDLEDQRSGGSFQDAYGAFPASLSSSGSDSFFS